MQSDRKPPSLPAVDGDSSRNPIELLATEFLDRQRKGENPDLNEYAARFPELADDLLELVAAMQALEGLKKRRQVMPPPPASKQFAIEQLGDFRIVKEIGRGGMGVVYEAVQQSLNRRVAIKMLPSHALLDPRQMKRFEREARTAANLHHPNIVPVFGIGEHDGHHFYVMQLINGTGLDAEPSAPLQRHIDTKPRNETLQMSPSGDDADSPPPLENFTPAKPTKPARMPPREAARLISQAAYGLQYAHEQGVLHRDIKPANLLRDEKGHIWIADFGLARAVVDPAVSASGDISGTLRYMAPERFQGGEDKRSDIYSLGLTLYEMVTGRPAFVGQNHQQLMERVLKGNPVEPRKRLPRLSRDFETIILKSIAVDPKNRYQAAGEMANDLNRWLRHLPIEAKRVSLPRRAWLWARRHPSIATLSSIVAVLLVILGSLLTADYWNTKQAVTQATYNLQTESTRRERAEHTSREARDTLNEIHQKLGGMMDSNANGTGGNAQASPLSPADAAVLEALVKFHEGQSTDGAKEPEALAYSAESSRRVGDIRRRLGHFDAAVNAYRDALEKYGQLKDRGIDPEVQILRMASILHDLSATYRTLERHGESFRRFQEGFALLNTMPAEISPAIEREQKYAKAKLMFLATAKPGSELGPLAPGPPHRPPPPRSSGGSPDSSSIGEAIDLLTELTKDDPTHLEYQRLLAVGCRQWADEKAPTEAAALRDRSVEILEALHQVKPDAAEYAFELAVSLRERSNAVTEDSLAPPTACSDLERARELCEGLVERHPRTSAYALQLGMICYRLAECERSREQPAEVATHLARAEEVLEAWQQTLSTSSSIAIWLAAVKDQLAHLALQDDDIERADEMNHRSIAILESLPPQNRGAPHIRLSFGALYQTSVKIDRAADRSTAESQRLADEYQRKRQGPPHPGRKPPPLRPFGNPPR